MDLGDYKKLKEKGTIALKKIGKGYVYEAKRYDPYTGEETDPEIGAISLDTYQTDRTRLMAQVEAIDEIIKDVDSLEGKTNDTV